MDGLLTNLGRIFRIFTIASILGLVGGFFFLSRKIDNISTELSNREQTVPFSGQVNGLTRGDVEEIVFSAMSTLSGVPTSTPTSGSVSSPTAKPQATPKADRIVYIPLGGPGSTQNATWTDINNAEVWINFTGEYGQLAKAWWDAFLRVDNSNGAAYARLFDVTHGTAVDGSEISLSNIGTATDVESGNLRLWSGRNLYRVQIKSLNSSYVFFDSGRIKISY